MIVAKLRKDMKDSFLALYSVALNIGLKANKTKNQRITKKMAQLSQQEISHQKGSRISCIWGHLSLHPTTCPSIKISWQITAENQCYFGIRRQMKSRLLTRIIKEQLYKTFIRPVLTNTSQTWTLTKVDGKSITIFERKNQNLYSFYRNIDILWFI